MLHNLTSLATEFNMLPRGTLILACVSGGADSMCLLGALCELSIPGGFTVAAAHYNHHLRGAESDRDEAFVRDYCRERDIPLYIGGGDVAVYAKSAGMGIEEAAREMRYAFFNDAARESGAGKVATAHTAGDNAETVIMNLTRGAGLAGLCGIPPVRGNIIRPMLRVTRKNVMRYLTERQIPFVEDSTNSQDIYMRNRIRHSVIPLLEEINPRFCETVAESSALLREDEAFIAGAAGEFFTRHCRDGTTEAAQLAGLHPAVFGRVVRRLHGGRLTAKHVSAVLRLCEGRNPSARVSLPGMEVYREYSRVVFGGEESVEFMPIWPQNGDVAIIPGLNLKMSCQHTVCSDKINKSLTTFLFKADDICGRIIIRPRRTGDKIAFAGASGTKSLKKLFIERRIPVRKRQLIPVVADDSGVLAVLGIGAGDRARANIGDVALEIRFEEGIEL